MPVKTILIVDDSPTERHVIGSFLARQGYQVVTAVNGEEGVALARQIRPDVILMDVVMPGVNGYQATRELAKDPQTQAIPVILCTSKNQETDRIWGMRQGAHAYLAKPVDQRALIEKIRSLP
jgi:twitching motility two-component system response regulator PilH